MAVTLLLLSGKFAVCKVARLAIKGHKDVSLEAVEYKLLKVYHIILTLILLSLDIYITIC